MSSILSKLQCVNSVITLSPFYYCMAMYLRTLKMHLKTSSGKWPPFCLGLNVLNLYHSLLGLVLWSILYRSGGYFDTGHAPKLMLNSNLTKSQLFIFHISQLSNWFQILHRAQQYHFRALCKWQNNLLAKMDVLEEQDFMRFEFKMSFGGLSHVAIAPRLSFGHTKIVIWYINFMWYEEY